CLSATKASSRFGPVVPFVPALASVWQPPQVATKSFLPAAASPEVTRPTAPQPTAVAATRPARPTTTGLRRGRQLLADGCDRLLTGAIDREDTVEPGDLEDLRDVPVAADERQPAVVRPQALDAAHEHAECGRVDEQIGRAHV